MQARPLQPYHTHSVALSVRLNRRPVGGVSQFSKHVLMQKQQGRRLFGQQVPWQVSVGAAFALTVVACARRRSNKARRQRNTGTRALAPSAEQVCSLGSLLEKSTSTIASEVRLLTVL